jgi:sigma-B regulation protein RsbU (phosphoserine phosphatase)
MEEAAGAVVQYLRANFVDKDTGEPSVSLARFYKTLPFERLDPELQAAAVAAATEPGGVHGGLHGVPCLTLLGTAGEEPAWNDRRASRGHRAIPLPSPEAVARLPMVAQLITELGLDPAEVVSGVPASYPDLDRRGYRVFYVADALDSPYVPAQNEFVVPYGIRSVLGFGGTLPSGAMFAVVVFSNTPIPEETADAFAVVALSVKVAVLPFVEHRTFDSDPPSLITDPAAEADRALRVAQSQVDALQQLIEVRERAVAEQSGRLSVALEEAHNRAEQLAVSRAELAASEARKAAIVSGALDCIISIDAAGRVLEFNPAAEATFGFTRDEAIGHDLAELILPHAMRARHDRGLRHNIATGEGPILNRRIEVTAVRRDGTELPVELTVTPVAGVDPPVFTGYLRDITERREAEAELLTSRERLAHIAHTLQASLLPPLLPEIPGVELASLYRPAGEGNEVGGDFYDVFELTDTRWALVLGDVCGKGPEAAAVTALARYTLRASAIRNPRKPATVLSELHEAMSRQRPDSFCTVAYAVVQPDRRHVDLVLGGHPPALLVRPDGTVERIGGRGPMIGLVERWSARSEAVRLREGDTVVLYSDGVTEARRGRELFGDERLRGAVSEAIGGTAADIVRAIEAAVLRFSSELSDDVAVLAAQMA